jgi:hypothetical protein
MPDEQLKTLTKLIHSRKQDTPYVVLLGSGLSMTSDLLKELGYANWNTFYTDMQPRSPNEWYSLLKEPLSTLPLQEGYRCLIQLLQAGYFNVILTTNFDSFLDQTINEARRSSFEEIDILVHGEQTTDHIVRALKNPQPRMKICLLRGRLRSRTIPNITGMLQFDSTLEEALKDLLKEDLIVLGVNDRDIDINRCISPHGGSIWYVTCASDTSDYMIRTLVQSRRGEIITGEDGDFNHFFRSLSHSSVAPQQSLHFPPKNKRNELLQVSVEVLYKYLPSGVLDLYNRQTMPLLRYAISNSTTKDSKLLLMSEIVDFSTPCRDTVTVKRGQTEIFYQLPRLKPEKAKMLTDIRPATIHVDIQYLEDGIAHFNQKQDFEVHLLARNVIRWAIPDAIKGSGYIPLLDHIAAWVTPRAGPVKQMLRKAANYIPAIFGYSATSNPESVREQVKAIYQALQDSGLAYIHSPFAIDPVENNSRQAIRLPSESLKDLSMNCIDGAVLYASLLEQAALEPVIVMQTGHAFVGWKTWPDSTTYEFLETTMTRDAPFEDAYKYGMEEYQKLGDLGLFSHEIFDPDEFARLLDIKALHDNGIYPMVVE